MEKRYAAEDHVLHQRWINACTVRHDAQDVSDEIERRDRVQRPVGFADAHGGAHGGDEEDIGHGDFPVNFTFSV